MDFIYVLNLIHHYLFISSGEDHQILINILKNKFNLECSIHKTSNGNRIYILSSSPPTTYE